MNFYFRGGMLTPIMSHVKCGVLSNLYVIERLGLNLLEISGFPHCLVSQVDFINQQMRDTCRVKNPQGSL